MQISIDNRGRICYNNACEIDMQVWRNRQTRMVQVHVSITLMQVQLLLPAPQKVYTHRVYTFCFFGRGADNTNDRSSVQHTRADYADITGECYLDHIRTKPLIPCQRFCFCLKSHFAHFSVEQKTPTTIQSPPHYLYARYRDGLIVLILSIRCRFVVFTASLSKLS